MMLDRIHRRTHSERVIEGAFHGVKIPQLPSNKIEVDEFPVDPVAEEKALKAAQARMRARYG